MFLQMPLKLPVFEKFCPIKVKDHAESLNAKFLGYVEQYSCSFKFQYVWTNSLISPKQRPCVQNDWFYVIGFRT